MQFRSRTWETNSLAWIIIKKVSRWTVWRFSEDACNGRHIPVISWTEFCSDFQVLSLYICFRIVQSFDKKVMGVDMKGGNVLIRIGEIGDHHWKTCVEFFYQGCNKDHIRGKSCRVTRCTVDRRNTLEEEVTTTSLIELQCWLANW